MAHDAGAFAGAPAQTGHVRLGPRFVEEYESVQLEVDLLGRPRLTALFDVGAFLFCGPQRFFYSGIPTA